MGRMESPLDWLEMTLHRLGVILSHLLDPVAGMVDHLNFTIRHQLDLFGVPFGWQSAVIATLWIIVVAVVVRTAGGWLRLALLIVLAAVLGRIYGLLPAA